MTTSQPVYRLTQAAYDFLRELAESEPALWFNPGTDFHDVLVSRGIDSYLEPTTAVLEGPTDYRVNLEGGRRPNQADECALSFYRSLTGISLSQATDHLMWSWFAHFKLHRYCIDRWPLRGDDRVRHIRQHYFLSDHSLGMFQMNVASRTWWLAHTAIKASQGSRGAFNPEEVVRYFADHAQHYHTVVMRESLRSPVVLAEFVRALLRGAEGVNNEGVKALWRRINLYGGGILLEAIPRTLLREIIDKYVDEVMSVPEYVADRHKLRNPNGLVKVLSLGAGVQSTVLALMAEREEYGLEKPDIAIFADTGWEPPLVYQHLDWLEKQLSFKVVRLSAGNIRDNIMEGVAPDGHKFLGIPVFTINSDGSKGRLIRQCTSNYKVEPIQAYLRDYLGLQQGRRAPKEVGVEMWLGISIDEAMRQKDSKQEWVRNRYPLVEREFSRAQLIRWFEEHYPGRELPKSACIGCPFHSDASWKDMKENDPESFAEAVHIDWVLRNSPRTRGAVQGEAYLHRSREPLGQVDFSGVTGYAELMGEECEGLCGI